VEGGCGRWGLLSGVSLFVTPPDSPLSSLLSTLRNLKALSRRI